MEFWGHEVKPGMTVSCEAGDGFVIHLSQVVLGETKKGSEQVLVFVEVGGQKLVIATLSADKHPQIGCDLIFDDTFELSHNSSTTSVFLCGYKSVLPDMFQTDSSEDEDEEMETDEIPVKNNETEKPAAKVPVKDGKKDKQAEDDESDSETSSASDDLSESDSDDDSISDSSSNEDDLSSGTDDISEDESDDDSEDETPVPEAGKKRSAATALKAPASDKKAKISIPKETGDNKVVHVATPHPAKQAKTPADGKLKEKAQKTPADSKPKEKTPKTPADSKAKEKNPKTPADSKAKEKSAKSGNHSCKSCSKTFNSAQALESHKKAKKHEA